MLIPSTVGFSTLKKDSKEIDFEWKTQFKIKQVKPQSMPLSYFPGFHHRIYWRSIHKMIDSKWWRFQETWPEIAVITTVHARGFLKIWQPNTQRKCMAAIKQNKIEQVPAYREQVPRSG